MRRSVGFALGKDRTFRWNPTLGPSKPRIPSHAAKAYRV
jgi:hypothetical protein